MTDKFRVGRRTGRAILYVETGHEYIVFPEGTKEGVAQDYCDYLNSQQQEISDRSYKAIKVGLIAIGIMVSFMFGMCEGVGHERELHKIIYPDCSSNNKYK